MTFHLEKMFQLCIQLLLRMRYVDHKCQTLKEVSVKKLRDLHRLTSQYADSDASMSFPCEKNYTTNKSQTVVCSGDAADDVHALDQLGNCGTFRGK